MKSCLRTRLPINEPAIYLHIFAFHFRFHFYREALLDRIREIEGDEEMGVDIVKIGLDELGPTQIIQNRIKF